MIFIYALVLISRSQEQTTLQTETHTHTPIIRTYGSLNEVYKKSIFCMHIAKTNSIGFQYDQRIQFKYIHLAILVYEYMIYILLIMYIYFLLMFSSIFRTIHLMVIENHRFPNLFLLPCSIILFRSLQLNCVHYCFSVLDTSFSLFWVFQFPKKYNHHH